ncbi:putative reverse transcriptase domain-containing protein [Tanacetum coccineum]
MEEFATNEKANYYSGITSIMVNGKRAYELKGKFLDDLRDNAFSGTNKEDTNNGQEGVADKEFSDAENANNDDEQETSEILRIETNLFDYETPLCTEFKEFNFLLKLADGNLKEEALKEKDMYEKSWGDASQSVMNFCAWLKRNQIQGPYANYYSNFLDKEEHEDKDKHGLFDSQKRPVCNIRRFEMIKYSFGDDEEYVAIKEHEYDDLISTNEDACRTYQEIFRRIDEGWMDDLEVFSIDDLGLDWISAHNFLTRLQKLSSYASGHLKVSKLTACLEKLPFLALLVSHPIMAASAIAISSDSSDESVGSPPSRVILFGDIPTVIPSTFVVAPETSTIAPVISSATPVIETTLVTSPIGLCGLIPYSDSDSDSPDEMSSSEHISSLPAISPFLCTDSSEAPDSSDGPPSQDPYVMTVARWRSKVASRPSSSSEFPIAPVTAPPRIRRRSAILIRPGEAIPFGRPYRTHLNGPRKLLTARKRVGPLPAHRLAWRRASPRSSDHHPSSSSSSLDSLPVHSSGLDAPDQAHSGSSTRDVSPRLGYPPRRAPRRSEAFRHWCATSLSTLYPPTTLESSSGDSSEKPLHSSSHFVGPSCKRCRSLVDYVPSFMPVIRSLAPTRVDLLPPRKRFRNSYSSEASIEEDTEIDPIETEADTSVGDTVEVVIDPMSAPIVKEEIVEPTREDSSDSSGIRIVMYRSEVRIDLDCGIEYCSESGKESQGSCYVSYREGLFEQSSSSHVSFTGGNSNRTMTNTRSPLAAIEEMINQRVDATLEARRVNRDLELENGNDNEGGDGNGNGNGNGTGNGNNRGNNSDGNENHNVNGRGDRHFARECTYQDFMKCQPLSFNGIDGVVGLIRWSKKIETVFHISNCLKRYQVKYATCTLLDSALTWWNSHKRTIETDVAYALSWKELLTLMTEVYCPRNEIQKMETELWNLSVKNNDMATYTQRFQELTMMCTKMVPEEEDQVEKFIGGLPDNIQGNVIAAEPTRL